MRLVALLPLKKNSDRIPGKNFKELEGRPLYAWILDTLLSIPAIDLVIINTDARAELGDSGLIESERVLIRDRQPELCGDLVSMNKIIQDDVRAIPAETFLMTHTTNPFLSAITITNALDLYTASVDDFDSLFTVNKIKTRFYRNDGSPINHNPDNLVRTQDLEPWFEENSCLYIFSVDSFERKLARIGQRPILFEIPALESVDIDNPHDWVVAEALACKVFGGEA